MTCSGWFIANTETNQTPGIQARQIRLANSNFNQGFRGNRNQDYSYESKHMQRTIDKQFGKRFSKYKKRGKY